MPLIPIFPLSSVLFPGNTMPLHIFEERYKLMIGECIDLEQPFGVVLIRSGREAGGYAVPHEVGTTARISRVQRLGEGRMNIETVGVERFRIVSSDRTRSYLQAEVEYVPRTEEALEIVEGVAGQVRDLFTEYYRLNLTLGDQWTRRVGLPSRPAMLADFVAGRIEADANVKQKLLETDSVRECLETETGILADAVTKLEGRVKAMQRQKYGGFGMAN